MNESYYEIMVQRKTSPFIKVIRISAFILTVLFAVLFFLGILIALIQAIICVAVFYVLRLYQSIEFEYLYVDKELQIDRILGRTKRKRMETLDINKLELLASFGARELEKFQGKNYVKKDYSSKNSNTDLFVLVIDGKMIYFEPSLELVNTIKMTQPRKVFVVSAK